MTKEKLLFKREITGRTAGGVCGRYIPNDPDEDLPQCMWYWDKSSGKIIDYVGFSASIVVGYASTLDEVLALY